MSGISSIPLSWDPAAQVAIVATSASRWYGAHLLLFLGMLFFVPGILALTKLAADHAPAAGADVATAVKLLQTFQAGGIFGALGPGLIAFFIGTALVVVPLSSTASPSRWPAIALALGALLIMGEIILAEVLLSQMGSILILVAGSGFASLLLRARGESPA